MNNTHEELEQYAAGLQLQLTPGQQQTLAALIKTVLDCLADPPRAQGVFVHVKGQMITTTALGTSREEAVMMLHAAHALADSDSTLSGSAYVQ
jgi:hypothetical protein